MKNIILIIVAAFAVAIGCSVQETSNEPRLTEQEFTIEARRVEEDQTRTYRDDSDMSIWWLPGDAISLFYGSGTNGGSKFTSNATEMSKVTNFTGTITAITGGGEIPVEETYFWGLYPYSEDASCDGNSVTMTLPKEQTAVAGTFATNTFPSIGRSQGLIMGFYNICSGIKLSVTKEGIKKVTVKSRNGEYLTGKAKVKFENGVPAAEIIDGSDEVVLEAPSGEYFEVGKYYFIVMFPTTFSNGFTVKLETFTEEAIVEKTGILTARRSNFGRIANIDANATYSQKTGNIPIEDANFKAYLVESFDKDGDGEISYEEARLITSISVSSSSRQNNSIESLQGIEYMINLIDLWCCGLYYNSWDGNTGKLKTIDISNNVELKTLWCYDNQLKDLDVSNNKCLTTLNCINNQIISLDLSNNIELSKLECGQNRLVSLNVSNNRLLIYLFCSNNYLRSLDLSDNESLLELWCGFNHLTAIDISNNKNLTVLTCYNNFLSTLDVSNNAFLSSIACEYNELEYLDVSSLNELKALYCSFNRLSTLDISKNLMLTSLGCNNNNLTDLNLSYNSSLKELYCQDNKLNSLNVSNNTSLIEFICSNNRITSIDVSNHTSLTSLMCSPMNDSNGNNLLSTLYIYQGQIIPNVTIDRNASYIPEETEIVIKPDDGGGEGTGEDDWGDTDPEAIDLGLSVKWASYDLGATAVGEWGGSYSWGAIEAWTENTSWSDYYPYSDYPEVLPLAKDAANVQLGNNWRMPTEAEAQELINNCTITKTTVNSVNCVKYTSIINGNSIYFPLARFNNSRISRESGSDSMIWTSSLYSGYNGDAVLFDAASKSINHYSRYGGLIIRPVWAESL